MWQTCTYMYVYVWALNVDLGAWNKIILRLSDRTLVLMFFTTYTKLRSIYNIDLFLLDFDWLIGIPSGWHSFRKPYFNASYFS